MVNITSITVHSILTVRESLACVLGVPTITEPDLVLALQGVCSVTEGVEVSVSKLKAPLSAHRGEQAVSVASGGVRKHFAKVWHVLASSLALCGSVVPSGLSL